jgi:two-component system chemotaxis sensor kinase CheA
MDDGRGLQIEKLREKAKGLGKWSVGEIEKWTTTQVTKVIFEPGVSMAENVSLVAGRGMGMSIIQEKVSKIGGTIEIETQEGKYCKFLIDIPLSSN